MIYYEQLANRKYRQNYYMLKNYKRNWWKYYYYQARSAGYDHIDAYRYATKQLRFSKNEDESKLLRFIRLKRDKGISSKKITPTYVEYDLLEEYLSREIKRMKQNQKRKE